mmetsp:Transcript_47101/g.108864  ORF Transcript_47101/g.108864 Transcript_47101/m.108864 type:complete len:201 (-) Transcript_47101:54-656(-)
MLEITSMYSTYSPIVASSINASAASCSKAGGRDWHFQRTSLQFKRQNSRVHSSALTTLSLRGTMVTGSVSCAGASRTRCTTLEEPAAGSWQKWLCCRKCLQYEAYSGMAFLTLLSASCKRKRESKGQDWIAELHTSSGRFLPSLRKNSSRSVRVQKRASFGTSPQNRGNCCRRSSISFCSKNCAPKRALIASCMVEPHRL